MATGRRKIPGTDVVNATKIASMPEKATEMRVAIAAIGGSLRADSYSRALLGPPPASWDRVRSLPAYGLVLRAWMGWCPYAWEAMTAAAAGAWGLAEQCVAADERLPGPGCGGVLAQNLEASPASTPVTCSANAAWRSPVMSARRRVAWVRAALAEAAYPGPLR